MGAQAGRFNRDALCGSEASGIWGHSNRLSGPLLRAPDKRSWLLETGYYFLNNLMLRLLGSDSVTGCLKMKIT